MDYSKYYGKCGFVYETITIGCWYITSFFAYYIYGLYEIGGSVSVLLTLIIGAVPISISEYVFRMEKHHPIHERIYSWISIILLTFTTIVVYCWIGDDKILIEMPPSDWCIYFNTDLVNIFAVLAFIPFILERIFRIILSIVVWRKKNSI